MRSRRRRSRGSGPAISARTPVSAVTNWRREPTCEHSSEETCELAWDRTGARFSRRPVAKQAASGHGRWRARTDAAGRERAQRGIASGAADGVRGRRPIGGAGGSPSRARRGEGWRWARFDRRVSLWSARRAGGCRPPSLTLRGAGDRRRNRPGGTRAWWADQGTRRLPRAGQRGGLPLISALRVCRCRRPSTPRHRAARFISCWRDTIEIR